MVLMLSRQMVCLLLEGHRLEESDFLRARAKLIGELGAQSRDLDSLARMAIFQNITSRVALTIESLREVTFAQVKEAISATVRSPPSPPPDLF